MDNNEMQNGVQNGFQNGGELETPLSLGEWIITEIIMVIPCVNIVMMFVWGFGPGNISRRNYCRAMLIVTAILTVILTILYATIAAAVLNALASLSK